MLNRSASLAMPKSVLKAYPGKLDIKRHSPSILYLHTFEFLKCGQESHWIWRATGNKYKLYLKLAQVEMLLKDLSFHTQVAIRLSETEQIWNRALWLVGLCLMTYLP